VKHRRIASIIRIEPKQILLWWNGKAHTDLLTFDDAGRNLLFDSLGDNYKMQLDKLLRTCGASWRTSSGNEI